MTNHSPRIDQLQPLQYPWLDHHTVTDIVVIWAGIAGCATTHFLLHETDMQVILVDGWQVAHGATWYNAGWISAETEVTFQHLVEHYGLEVAARTWQWLLDGYEMIWWLVDVYDLDIDIVRLMWYEAIASLDQLIERLEQCHLLNSVNITCETILLVEGSTRHGQIPVHLQEYVCVVWEDVIADLIESSDTQYQAVRAWKWGTANSALLCQKLVEAMLRCYPDRLTVYECTPVTEVYCGEDDVRLTTKAWYQIQCARVVLCTNGFEYLTVTDCDWDPIDSSFHNNITGVVGMMSWYYLSWEVDQSAVAYYPQASDLVSEVNDSSQIYYYMTQRWYCDKSWSQKRLVCIGWSDHSLADRAMYDPTTPVASSDVDSMIQFARETITDMYDTRTHDFAWHGLMWYTRSKLRCVWPDSYCSRLLYNLWCNGVGIVSSVYGWSLIAQHIRGEQVPATAFDPEQYSIRNASHQYSQSTK
jgi:glycine/D-amino acid oxidase-like deaminating enzyme